jgi:hypothetical protein
MYVDGETFPSTFGTGTEDYYGYAWGSPKLFMWPYHAQPRCDGPGTMGHDSVLRWHVLDPIPYTKSFRFDLELWHWAEVDVSFNRTVYWYARPKTTPPLPVDTKLLLPVEIERPKPVVGAIEGETMTIVSKSGGITEIQDFFELSNGKQLWWRDAKQGDRLVLRFNVPAAGTYEVSGNFCMANDYGIHKLWVGGKPVEGSIDFWSSGLKWEKKVLGTFSLPAGEVSLEGECAGRREQALPRNMFGLDYILLTKKESA